MKRRSVAEDITANLNRLLALGGPVEIEWCNRRSPERAYEVTVFAPIPTPKGRDHSHYNAPTLVEALTLAAKTLRRPSGDESHHDDQE